jgi:hypothetical protein
LEDFFASVWTTAEANFSMGGQLSVSERQCEQKCLSTE